MAARIIKSIDILEYSPFGLTACIPSVMPDQLSLALHGRALPSNVPRMMDLKNVSTMQCLTGDLQSKSAERGIVVIIFFPTHPLPGSGLLANHERGDFEAVLGQAALIRVGTILRPRSVWCPLGRLLCNRLLGNKCSLRAVAAVPQPCPALGSPDPVSCGY